MGFEQDALSQAITLHGRVARVIIVGFKGSSPRETGTAMLVWDTGQSGTIGGGALEFELAARARNNLDAQNPILSRHVLGPELGQCCGGAVTVVTEVFGNRPHFEPTATHFARCIDGTAVMPFAVSGLLTKARFGQVIPTQLCEGWLVEPLAPPTRPIWIWGAGHVGRAVVDILAPLPGMAVTWIDTHANRFPKDYPAGVTPMIAVSPGGLVKHAPKNVEHLVFTYSHALDLELCHQFLNHDFAFAGIIGSKTKWARFTSRLLALGHSKEKIARLTSPIGRPEFGKHPQAIAVGVAAAILENAAPGAIQKEQIA